jgi:eukaryotic-like serine/threonine-protein kinase
VKRPESNQPPQALPSEVAGLAAALRDRYAIEREIGRGGMATVYLAEDARHHRKVALKVLNAELGAVLGAERFLSEIEVTANLQHPNLLPLFDSGEEAGLLYYVMPYVEGESLRARLEREKQLPVDEAIRIAVAVASALDYAHARGVIHRDLKPENILLQAGQPVVADFGIALAVSNAGGARITQTGLSLGTPQYMSPEQATGDRAVDGRSDIYSLGAVLYEMLTGDPPHVGTTAQAIIARLLTEKPRSVRVSRPNVPAHVEGAVERAMAKLPADRFLTARDFAQALERRDAWTEATIAAAPGRPRWVAWSPWAVAAIAIVTAIAAIARGPRNSESTMVVASLIPPAGEDFAEAESFGKLSPDGKRFVFTTLGRRGETQLWIKRLDTLSAQRLPNTERASAPFWSPDGSQIAYFLDGVLAVIDLSGSSGRRICPIPGAYAGSWGRNEIIAVAGRAGIYRVDLARGDCKQAIKPVPGNFDNRHPALLPDARHVLYTLSSNVMVGDLETGETEIAVPNAYDPTYLESGVLVFALGDTEAGTRIWAQRFNPRTRRVEGPRVVLSEPIRTMNGVAAYAASASGSLVYLRGLGDRGVLITDRAGNVTDSAIVSTVWTHAWARSHPWIGMGSDLRFVRYDAQHRTSGSIKAPGNATAWSPAWSPGDSLVAYMACAGPKCGRIGVTRLATDRDTIVMASDTTYTYWPSSWTPDSRYLLFSRTSTFLMREGEIWMLDRTTGRTASVIDRAGVLDGQVSPDGKWLAYQSIETGRWEVYVRPFLGAGDAKAVSVESGRSPRWRSDGKELFYLAPSGHVMSVPVVTGASFSHSAPKPLFLAPGYTRHNFFDIGTAFDARPDGQAFSLRITATAPNAVLVQNWNSLLR